MRNATYYKARKQWIRRFIFLMGLVLLTACGKKETVNISLAAETDSDAVISDSDQGEAVLPAETETEETEAAQVQPVTVYVCGAVCTPGVYTLPAASRVGDAVEAAGGFSEAADREWLNLARMVEDGEQIRIPTEEEMEDLSVPEVWGNSGPQYQTETDSNTGKININTADAAGLMTLPGIGEKKAQDIISYRSENGTFQRPEDLLNVSGIGEITLAGISDYIEF